MTSYNIDVSEAGQGRFRAICRETGSAVISPNAEHDACHALTIQGWPDGPVQFWRGSTPSLWHRSCHFMGRYRIKLGDRADRLVKRNVGFPALPSASQGQNGGGK